jgi:hypothetical protein
MQTSRGGALPPASQAGRARAKHAPAEAAGREAGGPGRHRSQAINRRCSAPTGIGGRAPAAGKFRRLQPVRRILAWHVGAVRGRRRRCAQPRAPGPPSIAAWISGPGHAAAQPGRRMPSTAWPDPRKSGGMLAGFDRGEAGDLRIVARCRQAKRVAAAATSGAPSVAPAWPSGQSHPQAASRRATVFPARWPVSRLGRPRRVAGGQPLCAGAQPWRTNLSTLRSTVSPA